MLRRFAKEGACLPNGRSGRGAPACPLRSGVLPLPHRAGRGGRPGHGGVFDHARGVIDLERGLHLFFEPGLQSWFEERGSCLIHFADVMYVNAHFLLTLAFLVWLYFSRNYAFYFVRNMFIVAMGLALIGYVVFPTAPPRFMSEWGFQDAVSRLRRAERRADRQPALQPVRRDAQHARGVRADGRRHGLPARQVAPARRSSGPRTRCSSPGSSSSPPTTSGSTPPWVASSPPSPPTLRRHSPGLVPMPGRSPEPPLDDTRSRTAGASADTERSRRGLAAPSPPRAATASRSPRPRCARSPATG